MKLSSSSKIKEKSTSLQRTASSVVNLVIDLNIDSSMNIFQASYGVVVVHETLRGTPADEAKALCAAVLPVSADWEDVQSEPFFPVISDEVASCLPVLVTCCCCCCLPDPFRGMEAWRKTMEPQKPDNSPGSGPEVIKRQRVAKE